MKTHAIYWRSTLSGSTGTGTKLFEKEAAESLAAELNEKYPDIDHEAVIPSPAPAEPEGAEGLESDPS
jgi:hypothetical protein